MSTLPADVRAQVPCPERVQDLIRQREGGPDFTTAPTLHSLQRVHKHAVKEGRLRADPGGIHERALRRLLEPDHLLQDHETANLLLRPRLQYEACQGPSVLDQEIPAEQGHRE